MAEETGLVCKKSGFSARRTILVVNHNIPQKGSLFVSGRLQIGVQD